MEIVLLGRYLKIQYKCKSVLLELRSANAGEIFSKFKSPLFLSRALGQERMAPIFDSPATSYHCTPHERNHYLGWGHLQSNYFPYSN